MSQAICRLIAEELNVRSEQVTAAVNLIDDGNTVPFIARYRKEVTGGLDDTQLRNLDSRLSYLRELDDRRQTILKSIQDQGKLTPELERDITQADSKTRLEDLYLPYKPKRRTKGQIAIEAGLEPLADTLWNEPQHDPETEAANFISSDKGIADTKAALDGARAIVMERIAEDANLLEKIRQHLTRVTLSSFHVSWQAKSKPARNSKITSNTTKHSTKYLHTVRLRCCEAEMKAS